jgi:hypothetical protein
VEYIKWTLTDARATKIANDLGYASLPKPVLDLVMAKLNSLTCNGAAVAK